MSDDVTFRLNGEAVTVASSGSLLDALRDSLGETSVKDGCAPQGQCGACTVLINGEPRVSCVTAVTRAANADVTTAEGIATELRDEWIAAFEATGASQCGFCTPGILCRLVGTQSKRGLAPEQVDRALAAHLCRCTGWQPIAEAADLVASGAGAEVRNPEKAAERASLEQGVPQAAGANVVLGRAGFSDDEAPLDAQLFWTDGRSDYVAADSKAHARSLIGAVQGRNSTVALRAPLEVPAGEWVRTLQTVFVEPGYVEPDVSYAEPGGDASSPAANAGAFGAKRNSAVRHDAERFATQTNGPVKVVWSREAVVRKGKKRPPISLGLRADGSGELHIAVTPGSDDLSGLVSMIQQLVPEVSVTLKEVLGPPVGATHRGAVLSELLAARATLSATPGEPVSVQSPNGARATVTYDGAKLYAQVYAGTPLCPITLRSYVMGAMHQAFSMVTSEGLALDEQGSPLDLTIRSFGIVGAAATPSMEVSIEDSSDAPLVAGGAVFAATLAAVWLQEGGTHWPTRRKDFV